MTRKVFLLTALILVLLACRLADWLAEGTPYPTPRASGSPTAAAATPAPTITTPPRSGPTVLPPTQPPAVNLQPPPTLLAPLPQTSFTSLERVRLEWTWMRPLANNEYFDLQVAKDNPANMASIGCTRGPNFTYTLPGPGTYFWRVVVKSGAATPPVCAAQGDVSQPSEARPLIAQGALPPQSQSSPTLRLQATQPPQTVPAPSPTAPPPQPSPTNGPYP